MGPSSRSDGDQAEPAIASNHEYDRVRCGDPVPGRGCRAAHRAGSVPATGASSWSTTARPTAPPTSPARSGRTSSVRARPGYGAAVHAGMLAADAEYVAVIDGDASMRLLDLVPMLDLVRGGAATMAIGRRRPVARGVWPWHARAGTKLLAATDPAAQRLPDPRPRADARMPSRRPPRPRRRGPPLRLSARADAQAAEAGWTVAEIDVAYDRRAAGTKSKVSGSVTGTARVIRDFAGVLR